MIEIEKPRIDTEELSSDGKYGRFVVEPLERGFGNTLGNSLRRVLLSSLEGVAVTSIKIDGVLHEFSTIPGVKEDVTEIVLNMKSLVAKLHSNGPKIVEISAEGPCEVTAESIKCDSEVEILNPELHIASAFGTIYAVRKQQRLPFLRHPRWGNVRRTRGEPLPARRLSRSG